MKKILLLLTNILIGFTLLAQHPATIVQRGTKDAPQVTITVDEVGIDYFTCSFAKNDACASYYICTMTPDEVTMWTTMMQATLEQLVQMWGIKITSDTTYSWTAMNPNTEYNVYALACAADDTYNECDSQVVTTGESGGYGPAELTIIVTDITDSSAHIVCTPNENTSLFYDGLVMTEYLNEIGLDSLKAIFMSDPMQPLYNEDAWTWSGLQPGTSYTFVAFGQNANDEWSETATEQFATLSSADINAYTTIAFSMFPMPNNGNFMLGGEALEGCNMQIYNLNGQLCDTQKLSSTTNRIHTNMTAGTYILHITDINGKSLGTKKIVIY